MNSVLLYPNKANYGGVIGGSASPPAVVGNKLLALRALANSILSEVASLENTEDIMTQATIDLPDEVQRFETDIIRCALLRTGGRQRQAARLLNIKPTTLHAKMKRYGLFRDLDELTKEATGL